MWSRARILDALGASEAARLVDDAELVVSELLTNAMRAGCRRAGLRLTIDERQVRIAVFDDAPGEPVVIDARPEEAHGRGLNIVAALSSDWGVTTIDGSKEVWAALPVARREQSLR